MQKLSKYIDIILYITVAVVLTAAISSAIWDKPKLFSSVRSNSMYPLFQRSDLILIRSLSDKETVNIGDIVVFKVDEGNYASKGWIVHRIISGNEETGYITKGDANQYTDQAMGGTGFIQRNWIVSKVLTIGGTPLKIPLLGYLPLWMEQFQTNPYAMPIIAVVLSAIVGVSEFISAKKRKKKKKSGLDLHLIYFFSGLTISVIMGATMLATSQRVIVPYEVSASNSGVIMGSNVGIIKVGEEIVKPLSNLSNRGFFPIIATITTKDEQISFSHPLTILKPGHQIETEMNLNASIVGKFDTTIHMGMFYPFLPSRLIYNLCKINYWLAILIVSLIPGLPLMLYPLFDSSMRQKTAKEIRRAIRRIQRFIPVSN